MSNGVDFEAPPVTSVRLSVAFDRLPKVRAAHAGLLWHALGGPDRLPETEDLYVEPTEDETFPATTDRPPFDLALLDRPRPTRTALRSTDRTESVELQDDALSVLWTAQPQVGVYPRYPHVRDQFSAAWGAWTQVLEEHRLGVLRPRLAEVAYVNHLPHGDGWSAIEDLKTVIRLDWLPTPVPLVPEVPEDIHLYQRYVLQRDGDPFGRLYLSADSAREHEGKKALALALTVRGRPPTNDLDGTLALLDEGHKIIIQTFVSITTDEMHDRWGRRTQ